MAAAPRARHEARQDRTGADRGVNTAGLAHEINNCLVPILSLSELMLETLPQDSYERACVELINEAARRIRLLVQPIGC